jgi:hypothetical protein
LKTGVDWHSIFLSVAEISSPETREFIEIFAERPGDLSSLAAFNLREGHDSNGPTIQFLSLD